MNINEMFPNSNDDVFESTDRNWDFSYSLPVPKFDVKCPVCSHDKFILKEWWFHDRASMNTGTKYGYRCDVGVKCKECSVVWWHGVITPVETYNMFKGRRIFWREGKEIIENKMSK